MAIRDRNPLACKLLLGGVDPNYIDRESFDVPLTEAAATGQNDILELLLGTSNAVDVNMLSFCSGINDGDPHTALMAAASSGHLSTVQLLLRHDAEVDFGDTATALTLAVEYGYAYIVRELLDANANVNVDHVEGGYTALMLASYCGRPDIVEILLEGGADVTAKNRMGTTALMMAVGLGACGRHHGRLMGGQFNFGGCGWGYQEADVHTDDIPATQEVVRLLASRGASLDERMTALEWADRNGLALAAGVLRKIHDADSQSRCTLRSLSPSCPSCQVALRRCLFSPILT